MPAFGYILGGGRLGYRSDTNLDCMNARWREKAAEFRSRGGSAAVADAMERRWLARSGLLEGCRAPVLCHYDFHPGNLLAEPDGHGGWRLSGVLDFEDALAGDPLLDLGKCVHFARAGTGVRWRGLLQGYGPISRPEWRDTVELYRLFQAVEYWNWLAFLGRPETDRSHVMAGIEEAIGTL